MKTEFLRTTDDVEKSDVIFGWELDTGGVIRLGFRCFLISSSDVLTDIGVLHMNVAMLPP
jgi:hypothetical protein